MPTPKTKSDGWRMTAFFALLACGSLVWAVIGIATGRTGFIVFGLLMTVIFAAVGYVNSPRSVARGDHAKPYRWMTRRKSPRE